MFSLFEKKKGLGGICCLSGVVLKAQLREYLAYFVSDSIVILEGGFKIFGEDSLKGKQLVVYMIRLHSLLNCH